MQGQAEKNGDQGATVDIGDAESGKSVVMRREAQPGGFHAVGVPEGVEGA